MFQDFKNNRCIVMKELQEISLHKYPFVFICTNVYKKLFGVFYEARS